MKGVEVHIVESEDGWRWQLVLDGKVVASSARLHKDRDKAHRDAETVRSLAFTMPILREQPAG